MDVDMVLQTLRKPGVVFSEPVQIGARTVITASAYRVKGGRVTAKPIAVVVVEPTGVTVRHIQPPMGAVVFGFLIVATIFGVSSVILHPPWSPGTRLLDEVRDLITTIRGG